ncbi:MAG TPA: hypothetical protein VJZ27_03295 [Aggregatilineales bacterium]|nr:hypothetical protein [Aggregatilineales bacterium]
MTITTDLASVIGEIRLLIGDNAEGDGVKPGGVNFTDTELQYFYDEGGSVNIAAALACETLSWLWHSQPDLDAEGTRINRSKIAEGWWRAAMRFRANRGAKVVALTRQDAFSTGIKSGEASEVVDGEGMGEA